MWNAGIQEPVATILLHHTAVTAPESKAKNTNLRLHTFSHIITISYPYHCCFYNVLKCIHVHVETIKHTTTTCLSRVLQTCVHLTQGLGSGELRSKAQRCIINHDYTPKTNSMPYTTQHTTINCDLHKFQHTLEAVR